MCGICILKLLIHRKINMLRILTCVTLGIISLYISTQCSLKKIGNTSENIIDQWIRAQYSPQVAAIKIKAKNNTNNSQDSQINASPTAYDSALESAPWIIKEQQEKLEAIVKEKLKTRREEYMALYSTHYPKDPAFVERFVNLRMKDEENEEIKRQKEEIEREKLKAKNRRD